MKCLIDLIYLLALVIYAPKMAYRRIKHGRYKTGWNQRLGKTPRKCPDKRCIWIHAVSMGEVNLTQTLVAQLKTRLPEYEIVISTTTDTGFERATKLYGDSHCVFFFPFDISPIMKRAFDNLRPDMIILVELEIWPNLISIAKSRGVPVVIVNGRISNRSLPRYRLAKSLLKPVIAKISLFLAQNEEYAKRFFELGGSQKQLFVTGSLKYDTAAVDKPVDGSQELACQIAKQSEPLWVAGGTGDNEEIFIIGVYKKLLADFPDLRLAVVPRKPERFDTVAQLIEKSGLELVRYSKIKSQKTPAISKKAVILGDTMGDLRRFYAISDIIFVGRSLVPMGGSDMMEAAALNKCVMFGPHTENFAHTVEDLLAANGAIEVKNEDELYQRMCQCLRDSAFAAQIAACGCEVIIKNKGATNRTVEHLLKLIQH